MSLLFGEPQSYSIAPNPATPPLLFSGESDAQGKPGGGGGRYDFMKRSGQKTESPVRRAIDYVVPAAVSAVLIVWLFNKVNIHTVIQTVSNGCDWRWLLIMCGVLAASRSVRGLRWGIQLRAAGVRRMPAFAEMVAIYGAYALNLVLTGVGEAWRCVFVARRQKASLSTIVGTDIGDRLSDAIMISLITAAAFFLARPTIDSFLNHYSFGRHIADAASSPALWIILAVAAAATLWIARGHTSNPILIKIRTEAANLWSGLKVLFTMKHQVRFWSYTMILWVAYFMMTYLCFFAFPFTRALITPNLAYGLLPGLIVFVFGSLSIAVPSTGGLGPWNIAVMFALQLYGIDKTDAATYSLVVWAFQTATQVLLGIVSAVYISATRRQARTDAVAVSAPQSGATPGR